MIRLIRWIKPISLHLFVAYLIAMLIASSLPNVPNTRIQIGEDSVFRLDYLLHFMEYSVLTGLFLLYLASADFQLTRMRWIVGVSICLVIATADEWHQLLIEGRSFNPVDMLFNFGGIFISIVVCLLLFSKTHQQIIGES